MLAARSPVGTALHLLALNREFALLSGELEELVFCSVHAVAINIANLALYCVACNTLSTKRD